MRGGHWLCAWRGWRRPSVWPCMTGSASSSWRATHAPGGLEQLLRPAGQEVRRGSALRGDELRPAWCQRGTPLGKLRRQLRIPREGPSTSPSKCPAGCAFPGVDLRFANRFGELAEGVAPHLSGRKIDGFARLRAHVAAFDPFDAGAAVLSARAVLKDFNPFAPPHRHGPLPVCSITAARGKTTSISTIRYPLALYFRGRVWAARSKALRVVIRALLTVPAPTGVERRMKCGRAPTLVNDGSRIHRCRAG